MRKLIVVSIIILMLVSVLPQTSALMELGASIASLDVSAGDFEHNEWCWVSGTVYAFVNVYSSTTIGIVTVNISADGTSIVKKAEKNYVLTSSVFEPDIAKVNDTLYAVVYRDTANDGQLFTCTISNDGVTISNAIDTWEYDTVNGEYPSINRVNTSVDPSVNNTMLVCYCGDGQDGWARTINISDDGTIWKAYVASLEYDTSYAGYQRNVKACADNQHFIVCHQGGSTGLYARVVYFSNDGATITKVSTLTLNGEYYVKSADISINDNGNLLFSTFVGVSDKQTPRVWAATLSDVYAWTAKDVHVFVNIAISDPNTYDKASVEFINSTEFICVAGERVNFGTVDLTSGNIDWLDAEYVQTAGGKWVNILTPFNSQLNSGVIALVWARGKVYTYPVTDKSLCPECPECPECNSTNLTINELENNCTLNITQDYNSTNGWTVNASCDGNCTGGGAHNMKYVYWPIGLMVALAMMFFMCGYLVHEEKKKKKDKNKYPMKKS